MGEITDLIFTLLGKSGRVLNAQGKRVCFIIWSLCLAYWVIRNYKLGLMVQMFGCIFSFGCHIYGFITWGKKGMK